MLGRRAQVADMLGVGGSRIRQHVARRTLLAIKTTAGSRFPRFQFHNGHILPGWEIVGPRFPADAHPVAVEAFLATVSEELQVVDRLVSPRDWLVSGGHPETVAELVDAAYQTR